MTDPTTLGALLRELRTQGQFTQVALAATLDVHHTYLSSIEAGRMVPAGRILDAYAALAPDDERGPVRDVVYSAAGKIPPEVTAWLLAHPGNVDRVRGLAGITYPDDR